MQWNKCISFKLTLTSVFKSWVPNLQPTIFYYVCAIKSKQ